MEFSWPKESFVFSEGRFPGYVDLVGGPYELHGTQRTRAEAHQALERALAEGLVNLSSGGLGGLFDVPDQVLPPRPPDHPRPRALYTRVTQYNGMYGPSHVWGFRHWVPHHPDDPSWKAYYLQYGMSEPDY